MPRYKPDPLEQERIRKRLAELNIDSQTCVPDTSGGIRMDLAMAVEAVWYRDFPDFDHWYR